MRINRLLSGFGVLLFVAGMACAAPPETITTFDTPFLFAYGSWEKRVTADGGKVVLRGDGLTPQGGAGVNAALDLHEAADFSPTLKVKVGPANRMNGLRLLLTDTSGNTAQFNFTLPKPGDSFTTVMPDEGASFAMPNTAENKKGTFDLAKVMQWQIIGDWSQATVLDVEVDAVVVARPDAATLALRGEKAKKIKTANAAKQREQDEMAAKYKAGAKDGPRVMSVALAAPDIISVTIETGRITRKKLLPYVALPGDEVRKAG